MATMPQREEALELTKALALCVRLMHHQTATQMDGDAIRLHELIRDDETIIAEVRNFVKNRATFVHGSSLPGPYPDALAEIRDTVLVADFIRAIACIDTFCQDISRRNELKPHLRRFSYDEGYLESQLNTVPLEPRLTDIQTLAFALGKCLPLSIPRSSSPLLCAA